MIVDIILLLILFVFFIRYYLGYQIKKSKILFTTKQEKGWWTVRNAILSILCCVGALFFIVGGILIIINNYRFGLNVWIIVVLISFVFVNTAYNLSPWKAVIILSAKGIIFPGGDVNWQWVSKYEWIDIADSNKHKLKIYLKRLGVEVTAPIHGFVADTDTMGIINNILKERIESSREK